MADLTFARLNAALGQTAFSVSGANLTIDMQKLMGESAIANLANGSAQVLEISP